MFLDLSHMGATEIKATIVHQFGHALGLGHALMTKNDWEVLKICVYPSNIKGSLGLQGDEDFLTQWIGERVSNVSHDKASVMLYK